MKSLIIYGSHTKLTNAHKPVIPQTPFAVGQYFVRTESFNGDYPEALEKAKPMEGETVLNSVPLTPEST